VSDYGLDDRAIGVRSTAGAKDFSSNLCVETGSGDHLASCIMGTGGPFPGAKSGRGLTLTTHPDLVPKSRMSRSYTLLPLSVTMVCSGPALLLFQRRSLLLLCLSIISNTLTTISMFIVGVGNKEQISGNIPL
jgi:hypothetical protein